MEHFVISSWSLRKGNHCQFLSSPVNQRVQMIFNFVKMLFLRSSTKIAQILLDLEITWQRANIIICGFINNKTTHIYLLQWQIWGSIWRKKLASSSPASVRLSVVVQTPEIVFCIYTSLIQLKERYSNCQYWPSSINIWQDISAVL